MGRTDNKLVSYEGGTSPKVISFKLTYVNDLALEKFDINKVVFTKFHLKTCIDLGDTPSVVTALKNPDDLSMDIYMGMTDMTYNRKYTADLNTKILEAKEGLFDYIGDDTDTGIISASLNLRNYTDNYWTFPYLGVNITKKQLAERLIKTVNMNIKKFHPDIKFEGSSTKINNNEHFAIPQGKENSVKTYKNSEIYDKAQLLNRMTVALSILEKQSKES